MDRLLYSARRVGASFALLLVALLPSRAVRADVTYRVQAIAKQGDTAGLVTIKPRADLELGSLNDRGQITFVTENAAGGEALIRYTDGQLLPIAYAGGDAPGGTWPQSLGVFSPVSINQLGDIVFAPSTSATASLGIYRWEADTHKVTPIVLKGEPAVNGLTFENGGGYTPVINNFGEIAFPADVKNSAGRKRQGIFFQGRDGKLLPVALPDQELPDGHKIVSASNVRINDAGSVAFMAQVVGQNATRAYLWDKGPITPLAAPGMDAPGGGKFGTVFDIWLNNSSRSVTVLALLQKDQPNPGGFFRVANGQITPLLVLGQDAPDGGKVIGIDFVSLPNDADQQAIIATGTSRTKAAYVLDPDGKLSLVLKSGTTTDLGTLTQIGDAGTTPMSSGIALNNRGQVAFPARIQDGPAAILLLTPTAP